MNPCISRGGSSFKGAYQYYMHDKGSNTRERIGWTHTVNVITQSPDKAWRVMAFTAKSQDRLKKAAGLRSSGRKTEKPVLAYSLSWHPEQKPDKDHMLEVAIRSLKKLDLSEHEAIVISHTDTPHRHAHIIVNRIHPVTGKVANISHSFRKLSALALEYAKEYGLNYAPQRKKNMIKRQKGERFRVVDQRIQRSLDNSRDGISFAKLLSNEGLTLARGNKRIVVVDDRGNSLNPCRCLEGVRAKDLAERLSQGPTLKFPTLSELSQTGRSIGSVDDSKQHSIEVEKSAPEIIQKNIDFEKLFREEIREYRESNDYERIQKRAVELQKRVEKSTIFDRVFGIRHFRKNKLKEMQVQLKRLDRGLSNIRDKWKSIKQEIEAPKCYARFNPNLRKDQQVERSKISRNIQERIRNLDISKERDLTR